MVLLIVFIIPISFKDSNDDTFNLPILLVKDDDEFNILDLLVDSNDKFNSIFSYILENDTVTALSGEVTKLL